MVRRPRRKAGANGRASHASLLFDGLVVDNFAGGGGASLGMERALGRAVDVAINHDPVAVAFHRRNHPHTLHYQSDVFEVGPKEVTGGRPVQLAWFSPDCRHFSRAKGAKPVKKKIRGLAHVVVKWAKLVQPRVIILENVREFETWGPVVPLVKDGKPSLDKDGTPRMVPCPVRKGKTFRLWVAKLRRLGYEVEWRMLDAADFGAPTHRKRLFLVARCDGEAVRWPEPTHGPGRPNPYRTAAECLDWSLPTPSIFLTREEGRLVGVNRPLAEKTMRRIALGLKRFVIDHPNPFIVRVDHGGDHFRGQPVGRPLSTVTGSHGYGLAQPFIVGVGGRMGQTPPAPTSKPLNTITSKNDRSLAVPVLAPYLARIGQYGGNGAYVSDPQEPLTTVTSKNEHLLIATHVQRYFGGRVGVESDRPLPTITAIDHHAIATAFLSQHYGDRPDGSDRPGMPIDGPLPTTTARGTQNMVCAANLLSTAHLMQYYGRSVGQSVDRPAPTAMGQALKTYLVTPSLVTPTLLQYNQEKGNETRGQAVDEPINTIVTENRFALAAANLIHLNHGEKQWSTPDAPLRTVLAGANHHGLVRAFLTKWFGTNLGHHPGQPLQTITAKDRFGVVTVGGVDYEIGDIGLRMLTPRELFRCQGFPDSYVIDMEVPYRRKLRPKSGKSKRRRDDHGPDPVIYRPLPKNAQVRMVGNSVSPFPAEALVRANLPELCVPVAGGCLAAEVAS